MPVYNAEMYIHEAVESILKQTYTDFEFIIINDGSTDYSAQIILAFSDDRIKFINRENNIGLVKTLNEGLSLVKGKYIARMDNDDIALPDRLMRQFKLMEAHPEIGLCGTGFQPFGTKVFAWDMPIDDSSIREYMLFGNPIGHPTVMMRSDIIKKYDLLYDISADYAEDYKMWYELSKHTKMYNIPDVLLNYRTHEFQISTSKADKQLMRVNEIRIMQLTDKGFVLSKEEQNDYCNFLSGLHSSIDYNHLKKLSDLIDNILKQNTYLKAYDKLFFEHIFAKSWLQLINKIVKFNPKLIRLALFRNKFVSNNVTNDFKIKFIIKSLIYWR